MKDEWFLYKTTDGLYHFLLVQEDLIVLRLTATQARKIYNLLKPVFEDQREVVFDRT